MILSKKKEARMSLQKDRMRVEISKKIYHFLTQNLGWKIEMDTQSFESKIIQVFKELECTEEDSYLQCLENQKSNAATVQAFAREFSVGESYFFRDTNFFDQFEHNIIPKIIAKNERRLAIWSVGCSRGEELYSIAMVLRRMIPNIESWNLYLLGSDVNTYVLSSAEEGIFNQYSFRKMPQSYMNYFQPLHNSYALHSEIKKMVHFKYHNIMSAPSPCLPSDGQGFDLILLNNVLIYFELQKAKEVVTRLFSLLKEGGWLATTATEYSMEIFDFPHSKCQKDGYIIEKLAPTALPLISPPATITSSESNLEKYPSDIYEEVTMPVIQSSKINSIKHQKLNNNKGSVPYHNALKMLESGDVEGAKVALRQALYLNNGLIMAHVILGNILQKEKKIEAAVKHISNAKAALSRMGPQEAVELSDGIMASDLLGMLNAIELK